MSSPQPKLNGAQPLPTTSFMSPSSQQKQGSVARKLRSNLINNVDKKDVEGKRASLINNPKNLQIFGAFPQFPIMRVDSTEHKEKIQSGQANSYSLGSAKKLEYSIGSKANQGGDIKDINISVDHNSNNGISSNKYVQGEIDNIKSINKNEGGLFSNTSIEPSYSDKYLNNQTENRHLGISPMMVNSMYSRQEISKDDRIYHSIIARKVEDQESEKAYDLYTSRHPRQSIKKTTIEISKAISSNTIIQLEKQNDTQDQKIRKLEKQLVDIKGNIKKWDQIKYRYTMDLESKSRQIVDLQRVNKRLNEEVQDFRSQRVIETMDQSRIVKLNDELNQLKKKNLEMQAEYYRNQKQMLEKTYKKMNKEQESEQEIVKKMEQLAIANIKQAQQFNFQLNQEKEKIRKLENEKLSLLTQKNIIKENLEKEVSILNQDINRLKKEVQHNMEVISQKQQNLLKIRNSNKEQVQAVTQNFRSQLQYQRQVNEGKQTQIKQLTSQLQEKNNIVQNILAEQQKKLEAQVARNLEISNEEKNIQINNLKACLQQKQRQWEERLNQQRVGFEKELIARLEEKNEQYKSTLNNELRLYEIKVIEQFKNEKLKQNEKTMIIDQIRQESQQRESSLKKTIIQLQQALHETQQKLSSQQQAQQIHQLNEALIQAQMRVQEVGQQISKSQAEKIKIDAYISEKLQEIQHLQNQIVQVRQDLNTEVASGQVQRSKLASEVQKKQEEEFMKIIAEYEAKISTTNLEMNNLRREYTNLEQKSRQSENQYQRVNENVNTWRMKSESWEGSFKKLKLDIEVLENERKDLRQMLRDFEEHKVMARKYQQLVPEYDVLKQKLKFKEQEQSSRQHAFNKVKHSAELSEQRSNALMKEIRMLTNKVDEAQAKLKTLLVKTEQEQSKYKQLYDKMVKDSGTYMNFIRKLQEKNQIIAQNYWKMRKLVKKDKLKDYEEAVEANDDSEFRNFLSLQIVSNFNKVLIPELETKLMQKLVEFEMKILKNEKKIDKLQVKNKKDEKVKH